MQLFRKNLSKLSDEDLMSMLAHGEHPAFDELYKRFSQPMFNLFYRLLNSDREKAEDMLHDLFLKIIEHPEKFDHSFKFTTWIHTLAGNMIRNEYRSQTVRNEYSQHITRNHQKAEQLSDELDKQLFDKKLQSELDKLEPEQRLLFHLRFVEEMNMKQIAQIIDCPEGTVKSRLFYLTRHLATKLFIYKPQ